MTQTLKAYAIRQAGVSSVTLVFREPDTSNLSSIHQRTDQGPRSSSPQREAKRGNENPHYVLYFLIAQNLAQIRWTQFSSSRDLRTTHLCEIVFLAQKDPSPQLPPASTNLTGQIPLSQQDLQACQSPFWTLPGLRNRQALHFLVLAALTWIAVALPAWLLTWKTGPFADILIEKTSDQGPVFHT